MSAAALSQFKLSHYVSENPINASNSHYYKEKLWIVAEAATVVAFIGIASGAVVFTGLYAASYVPVALIGSLCGVQFAMPLYLKIHKCREDHGKLERIESGVSEEFQKLGEMSPDEYRNSFLLRGINAGNIENFNQLPNGYEDLKPILARSIYWKNQRPLLIKESDRLYELGQKENDHRVRNEYRKAAFDLIDEAFRTKIREAFMRALLQKPHHKGEIADICDFVILPFEDRCKAMLFKDSECDLGIIFNARFNGTTPGLPNLKDIGREELSRMEPVDLKDTFLACMK